MSSNPACVSQGGASSWSSVGRAGVWLSGSEHKNLPLLFVLFICSSGVTRSPMDPTAAGVGRAAGFYYFYYFHYCIGLEWLLCSNK